MGMFPSQPINDFIALMPGALMLGIGGYFAARTTGEKKILNFGIGFLVVLIIIAYYLYIYMIR